MKSVPTFRFPFFSCILFLLIAAASMTAYIISARQINHSFVEQQLAIASETIKLRLASAVNSDLTLALKMADTPVIVDYFLDPSDAELERRVMEEFDN
jgi:methyl-accepting chemotaxis protein